MISQDLFEKKIKELITYAGWRVKQENIIRTYDKVKYVDRKAFEAAVKDMEMEAYWNMRVFVQMCWNHHGKIKDDDQYARDAQERRTLHEDRKNSRTADCDGGDKCRQCQEKYCDTVAAAAKVGIRRIRHGEPIEKVHADLGRRFPGVGTYGDLSWDQCAYREEHGGSDG